MIDLQAIREARAQAPRVPEHDAAEQLPEATSAFVALINARWRVQHLQRDVVLGLEDDDVLDSAVLAYRAARVHAARWVGDDLAARPSQEELFVRWIIEAAQERPAA